MMIFVHILESAKNGPQKILALCKKLKGYRKLIKIKTVATQACLITSLIQQVWF